MLLVVIQPQNERSRRTARDLLDAARSLVEENGFEAATMAAVADRAGVTRRAVYLHFPSRAALIGALYDHVNDRAGLGDSLAGVWQAPDAAAALDEWAAHIARFVPHILAVARAVERVHRRDPDAARHRAKAVEGRRGACRRLTLALAREGRLAEAWTPDTAADMLIALSSLDVVETLLVDRHWSRRRLDTHLRQVFRATFVRSTTPG
jgi:AcrR family transcriptional regulator